VGFPPFVGNTVPTYCLGTQAATLSFRQPAEPETQLSSRPRIRISLTIKSPDFGRELLYTFASALPISLRLREVNSSATMGLRIPGAFALAALSLSWVAAASRDYSSIDMMRAQIALLDDRPKDCPPWDVLSL